MSSAGSPKNLSPPCSSITTRRRWIEPMVAAFDIAIFGADVLAAVGEIGEERAQILEIEKGQAFLVGDLEGDIERAFLGFRKPHEPRQQQRPHFGDRGADRMTLLAEQVPEDGRRRLEAVVVEADLAWRAR